MGQGAHLHELVLGNRYTSEGHGEFQSLLLQLVHFMSQEKHVCVMTRVLSSLRPPGVNWRLHEQLFKSKSKAFSEQGSTMQKTS